MGDGRKAEERGVSESWGGGFAVRHPSQGEQQRKARGGHSAVSQTRESRSAKVPTKKERHVVSRWALRCGDTTLLLMPRPSFGKLSMVHAFAGHFSTRSMKFEVSKSPPNDA